MNERLSNDEKIVNCLLALSLWAEVPPRKVISDLNDWKCGTQACFGGHLATWPEFQEQGVMVDTHDGSPRAKVPGCTLGAIGVSQHLFGDATLFYGAGHHIADEQLPSSASAHRIVVNRLEHQIMRLQAPWSDE